jgi:hypothetical protein
MAHTKSPGKHNWPAGAFVVSNQEITQMATQRPKILYRVVDPQGIYPIQAVEVWVELKNGRASTMWKAGKLALEAMAGCKCSDIDSRVCEETIRSFSIQEMTVNHSLVLKQELQRAQDRLERVLDYLRRNAQYWDDKRGEVEYLREQITRLEAAV